MYTFRKGTKDDIPQIAQIYDHILNGRGERQNSYRLGARNLPYSSNPRKKLCTQASCLWWKNEGVVQAAARINRVQVPEYANADWEYSDAPEDQIMVLHTLVVEPKSGGTRIRKRVCGLL